MQVDSYKDKDGNTRYSNYVLVEDLEYLERKKEYNQENEYKDLKTKTQVQDQFEYDSSELPF